MSETPDRKTNGQHAPYYDDPPENRWTPPPSPERRSPPPLHLPLLRGSEAAKAPLHRDTVVEGLLHLGSLSLISGKPKSGKSFLATDLARAVADELVEEWMGQRIKQHGPVLYIACEGHGGFWKRLQAAGSVPADFFLCAARPKLIIDPEGRGFHWIAHPEDIEDAIERITITTGIPPILVVIDTVFRSFGGGDANKSADMNAYVAACQTIADRGIAVLLVHHANKSNNLPSGSIALMGAADTLISVERNKDADERTWAIDEAKDGAETLPRLFYLQVIDDILDAFGERVSSCRVIDHGMPAPEPAEPRPAKVKRTKPEPEPAEPPLPRDRPLTDNQRLALEAIEAVIATAPDPAMVKRPAVIAWLVMRNKLLLDDKGRVPAKGRVWVSEQLQALVRKGLINILHTDDSASNGTITVAAKPQKTQPDPLVDPEGFKASWQP